MNETLSLVLIIWLLYLTECFAWVHKQSVVFVRRWTGGAYAFTPGNHIGNSVSGLIRLNLVPPFGRVYISHRPSVSFSPTHVCSYIAEASGSRDRPPQHCLVFAYEDIDSVVSEGNILFVNGARFAICRTPQQAGLLAQSISALLCMDEDKRSHALEGMMDALFDAGPYRERLEEFRSLSLLLQSACSVQFALLLIAAPIALYFYGSAAVTYIGAATMVVAAAVSILFYRLHKRFYPESTGERIAVIFKAVACPPMGIRALDFVSAEIVSGLHPAALSGLLMDGTGYSRFAKRTLLDLGHPLSTELSDEHAVDAVYWHAANTGRALTAHLRKAGVDVETLVGAPEPEDGSMKYYCPRCLCQFKVDSGGCPDCAGVKLAGFDA